MLIEEILSEAGIPAAETLFLEPPDGVFAVWGDEVEAEGSDFRNEVATHNYTLEVYEPRDAQSPKAHRSLQEILNINGIEFHKGARIFYQDIQYFCTTYSFGVVERMNV